MNPNGAMPGRGAKPMLTSRRLFLSICLLACSALAACASGASPAQTQQFEDRQIGSSSMGCRGFGGVEGEVCRVPLDALILDPTRYRGKVVRTVGWLASGPAWMLFSSREAFLASDLSRAVVLRDLAPGASAIRLREIDQQYVGIVATFDDDGLDWGGERTAGALTNVVHAGRRSMPWGQSASPPRSREED